MAQQFLNGDHRCPPPNANEPAECRNVCGVTPSSPSLAVAFIKPDPQVPDGHRPTVRARKQIFGSVAATNQLGSSVFNAAVRIGALRR